MSNELNGVNGTAVQDAGLPKPEFSDGASVGSTSQTSPDTIAELSKALIPVIESTIERKLQSTKDKRFSKLEKGNMALTEVLANLEAAGATIPPEVKRDYQLRDYVDKQVAQGLAVAQSDNGMSQSAPIVEGQFDALGTIKSLGLDTNDAEVLKLMSGKYKNSDHFQLEATKLALARASKPAPSNAGSPPLGGGNPSGATLTDVQIDAKYKELGKLYLSPTVNALRIKALEKELEL